MQAYYDLFQYWVHYRTGFILLFYYTCILFLSVFMKMFCLRNVNQYYRNKSVKLKKKIEK